MPWLTIGIMALCTLVQIYASFIAPDPEEVAMKLVQLEAMMPEDLDPHEQPEAYAQHLKELERHAIALANQLPEYRFGYRTGSGLSINLVTSAFVHAGWLHLIGNMLFLWLAGSALEDRYGRARFAGFYVIGAALSTLAFEVAYSGPGTTLVGASGAVSACMGAFLVHFRKTQITFWYLFGRASGTFRLSAYVALPLWLADQLISMFMVSGMAAVAAIAYEAHLGGFVAGAALGFASSKLFPHDADHDDVEHDAPVAAPPPQTDAQLDDRIAKCLAALHARELGTVRTLASRVIIDLARVDNYGRILQLYQEIEKHMTKVPLTDGAFAAAANAADQLADRRSFVAIAGTMLNEHPGSLQLPKVLWRLAHVYREMGEHELEHEALRTLAQRFARDPLGAKAQLELDRQR